MLPRKREFVVLSVVALAAAVAVPLALSARSAAKPTVTVLITAPVNSTYYTAPQDFDAANIFAKYWNSQPSQKYTLKIVTCDNQFSPTGYVACAQQAQKDGAVATAGIVVGNTAMMDALAKEGIAWVPGDAAGPVELQSPISFPVNASAVYLGAGAVAWAAKDHCKSTSLWVNDAISFQGPLIQKQLEAQGLSNIKIVNVPGNATDVSPYVAQVAGSDCLLMTGVNSQQIVQIGAALPQSGTHFAHIISAPALTQALISQQKGVWNTAQIGSSYTYATTKPWDLMRNLVDKQGKYGQFFNVKAPYGDAQQVWLSLTLLKNIFNYLAANGQPITNSSVLAALKSDHTWKIDDLSPPVNFTKSSGIPGSPRIVMASMALYDVKNDTLQGAFGNRYIPVADIIENKKSTNPFFK
jgi:hypothetical protein